MTPGERMLQEAYAPLAEEDFVREQAHKSLARVSIRKDWAKWDADHKSMSHLPHAHELMDHLHNAMPALQGHGGGGAHAGHHLALAYSTARYKMNMPSDHPVIKHIDAAGHATAQGKHEDAIKSVQKAQEHLRGLSSAPMGTTR